MKPLRSTASRVRVTDVQDLLAVTAADCVVPVAVHLVPLWPAPHGTGTGSQWKSLRATRHDLGPAVCAMHGKQ